MPSPTLFSLDEPLTPASEREEPVLWLKRLVILPDLHAVKPIRDIPFRRGLNIIQTRQRQVGETVVVGHSVGKTLLMRLIRYTLGEHHFAVEPVRTRIASLFRTAQVVAHWRVNAVDWIVVRPLQEARSSKSIAVKADDWRAAIHDEQAHQPIGDFLAALNETVFAELSEFTLPRARRSPKWLDVLGWLARDYECGYRAPNEWRHKDADSETGLDRDDNSVILQWMAGLMGSEEIDLKHRHQELLEKRQKAKTIRDSAQKTIDVIGPALFAKLELPNAEEPIDDKAGLFSAQVVKTADERIESLKRLKTERIEQSTLETLKSAEKTAQQELNVAEADVLAVAKQIELVEGLIQGMLKAGSRSVYAIKSPYEDCPYDACELRLKNRSAPQPDPATDHNLTSLRDQLIEHQQSLPLKTEFRDAQQTARDDAAKKVQAERDRISTETSGIDREIGRWQGYRNDAEGYSKARTSLDDSTQTAESLDGKIEESYQIQEAARQNLRDRLNRLSECYEGILKQVFGKEANGRISVDGNGLHPAPDNRLAPNGAALSIMTTVLAFDISIIAASIAGIGHHPRLLIHDSPCEGDMEKPLFHQLFHVARNLELLFGDKEPSFQYIITTTTPPPAELADEAGPFVCLTLDARIDVDHLLGASF